MLRPLVAFVLLIFVTAFVLPLTLPQALGGSPVLHIEEDLTGRTIACDSVNYTITSGSALLGFRESTTPSGNFSGILTFTAKDLMATDGFDTFLVRGAAPGSATANATTGGVATTFVSMLQIVSQGGGVVASVQVLAHLSPNTNSFAFDFGECAPPL